MLADQSPLSLALPMVVGARRARTSKLKNRQPEDGLSGRRVGGEKSDVTADAQCDKPSVTLQVRPSFRPSALPIGLFAAVLTFSRSTNVCFSLFPVPTFSIPPSDIAIWFLCLLLPHQSHFLPLHPPL